MNSVDTETVDGPPKAAKRSGQGLSVFAIPPRDLVCLFRGLQKSENEALVQKMLFQDRHWRGRQP
jgi:hypothetical protein